MRRIPRTAFLRTLAVYEKLKEQNFLAGGWFFKAPHPVANSVEQAHAADAGLRTALAGAKIAYNANRIM